jgi:hypothetical protein
VAETDSSETDKILAVIIFFEVRDNYSSFGGGMDEPVFPGVNPHMGRFI